MKMITNLSKRNYALKAEVPDQRWRLWVDTLKEKGYSLKETLIRENMDYLGWSRNKVLSCWGEAGTRKIKEKWLSEKPNSKKEIEKYYNEIDLYIPELSSWHAMEKNEDLLKIIEFMQFCIKKNAQSFLDFGAGIGSSGLLFYCFGFTVTLADISDVMLKYTKWRFGRHDAKATFIDLKKQPLEKNTYDCVTAIEVLEHVINPIETMNNIRLSLKKGGYIFMTTPFYKDPERPQHLIHDIKIVEQFEKIGFKLIFVKGEGLYRLLKRIK